MQWLFSRKKQKTKTNFSTIQIYYNARCSLDDIVDVLYPLFDQYYPFHNFISMISTINHIFCAYSTKQGQYIACALLNDVRNKGLYIMLFGVQKSNQERGIGTRLLQAIIQWARQTGRTFLYLHVHVENYKAIGLYEKVGFIKQAYKPNYYASLPKYPPHAFQMILPLRSSF